MQSYVSLTNHADNGFLASAVAVMTIDILPQNTLEDWNVLRDTGQQAIILWGSDDKMKDANYPVLSMSEEPC